MDSVLVFWQELATNLRGSFTIMEKALTNNTSTFTSKNQDIAQWATMSSQARWQYQARSHLEHWISGLILPHFDVRTISVASKLKELQIFFLLLTKNI